MRDLPHRALKCFMETPELKKLINEAFKNVTLEDGVSLHQAEVMDNYGEGVTAKEFEMLPESEITNDWATISASELNNHLYLVYMDAKGFRYYIPAFMMNALNEYEDGYVVFNLLPEKGDLWEYKMAQYALLDDDQRKAIAQFLQWAPYLLDFDLMDEMDAENALKNYWHQYL